MLSSTLCRLSISLVVIGSCLVSSQRKDPVHTDFLDASNYPGSLCDRNCTSGDYRLCHFEFTLEHYHAMGTACGNCSQGNERDCRKKQCVVGDGTVKPVMSINRQVPGPAIQVCKDDIVVVDFHNQAHGTADSLHWHGVHMDKTPYMDGVPYVTQCPIPYSSSFRYQFRATEAGTHFYHSHSGHHKANGEYGALIVREPENDRSLNLYEYDLSEHYILISDWMHTTAEQEFPGLVTPRGIAPESIVVNGRGVFRNPQTKDQSTVRPEIFYVVPGKRYRFRLINSMNHACPVQMQIQDHDFLIIASDSFDVSPEYFDTLVSNAGERYDFVLNANRESGDYWIRFRGFGACFDRPMESYILIRYANTVNDQNEEDFPIPPFPNYYEPYAIISALNHPNATCWSGDGSKCITELTATTRDDELLDSTPHFKFFLGFDNYDVPNEEIHRDGSYKKFGNLFANNTVIGGINNISLEYPDFSLLTQPDRFSSTQFCNINERPRKCTGERVCHCTHRIKVPLNSIVELIIVDETDIVNTINHPFHLHGYNFKVIGMGRSRDGNRLNVARVNRMETDQQLIRYIRHNPPLKDTVSIPSRGYVIVRLRASNPGFWLMHCHYEWHLGMGMGLIFQVGEQSEMQKAPKDFPTCGSYLPSPTKKPRGIISSLLNSVFNAV